MSRILLIEPLGLHTDVKQAYNFISTNWGTGKDEIYLVGFSRGAYTVRCLAAFMNDVGLLTKPGLLHLNYLYKLWLDGTMKPSKSFPTKEKGNLIIAHLNNMEYLRPDISIEACVVWDTVSALGIPNSLSWLQPAKDDLVMVDKSVPRNISNVFHALALNERRGLFKPNLWSNPPHARNFKQCWFLGAHSDVGGGYKDIGIANISLIWMVAQLKRYTKLKISDDVLKEFLLPRDDSVSHGSYEYTRGVRTSRTEGFNPGLPMLVAKGTSWFRGMRLVHNLEGEN